MSGHSKFANIKHKKEKNDAAKGKIFTMIGREIAVAVKEGGADPANNSKLAAVISKAKANNMPNDTIERGIKKAAGDGDNVNYVVAKRIRSLEIKKESMVGEGIRPEFVALINYGIVGLIQVKKGFADTVDITCDEALALYDRHAREALELMKRKNHDYDEAWRSMRVSSYTDFILTKLQRIKEIEDLQGDTLVSEGIDANYMDIINYAVFALIKLS